MSDDRKVILAHMYAGQLLGAIFYGALVCVFSMTIYLMACAKTPRRMSIWSYAHACAMFAFATLQMVGNAYDVFLYTGGYLEPWDYSRDSAFYGLNLGAAISFALAILFQDSMLIYRLLVIWNYNYGIVIVPVLVLFASTGLSITVVLYCYSAYNLGGPTLFPFVALSVALNISLTLAIVGRLYYLRKRIAVLGPEHGKTYTTLASMFFESGALYSIMGIIYLGSLRSHSYAQDVISTPLQQSVSIASELIWLRIAMGRSITGEVTAQITSIRYAEPETGDVGQSASDTQVRTQSSDLCVASYHHHGEMPPSRLDLSPSHGALLSASVIPQTHADSEREGDGVRS